MIETARYPRQTTAVVKNSQDLVLGWESIINKETILMEGF